MQTGRNETSRRDRVMSEELTAGTTALADTNLFVAVEFIERGDAPVAVLTDDKTARDAIQTAVAKQGYDDSLRVLSRDDLLDESDDGVRII